MTQLTRNYLKMEQAFDQSKITKRNEDGSKNPDFNGTCYARVTAIVSYPLFLALKLI